eukprot:403346642
MVMGLKVKTFQVLRRRTLTAVHLTKETQNNKLSQINLTKMKMLTLQINLDFEQNDLQNFYQRKCLASIGGSASNKSINLLTPIQNQNFGRQATISSNRLRFQNKCKQSLVISRPSMNGLPKFGCQNQQNINSATTNDEEPGMKNNLRLFGTENLTTQKTEDQNPSNVPLCKYNTSTLLSQKSFSIKSNISRQSSQNFESPFSQDYSIKKDYYNTGCQSMRNFDWQTQLQTQNTLLVRQRDSNLRVDDDSLCSDEEDINNFENNDVQVTLTPAPTSLFYKKRNSRLNNNTLSINPAQKSEFLDKPDQDFGKSFLFQNSLNVSQKYSRKQSDSNAPREKIDEFESQASSQLKFKDFDDFKKQNIEVRPVKTQNNHKFSIQIEQLSSEEAKCKRDSEIDKNGSLKSLSQNLSDSKVTKYSEKAMNLDFDKSEISSEMKSDSMSESESVHIDSDLHNEEDKLNDSPYFRMNGNLKETEIQQQQSLPFEDQYEIDEFLGEGCSSIVKRCHLISDPQQSFAVKIMRVPDQELYQIALKEFDLLDGLGDGHQNIMKVYDIFYNQMKEQMFIIMEYAGQGSNLQSLLKKIKNSHQQSQQQLEEPTIKKIMKQLLEGLYFIHENQICHRDVKPGNIYISEDLNQLKIIDFNASLQFKHQPNQDVYEATMFGVTGEEKYSAPELSSGQYYSENVDCWSAGVVMFMLMTQGQKKLKYNAQKDPSQIQEKISKQLEEIEGKWTVEMKQLLYQFLESNPKKRINAKQALNHQWFHL